MNIKYYKDLIASRLKEEKSIDFILEELKKHKIPPNFCIAMLREALNINYDEAYNTVFSSKHYKEFKDISDFFSDSFLNIEDTQ